jgi:hypothetical protein
MLKLLDYFMQTEAPNKNRLQSAITKVHYRKKSHSEATLTLTPNPNPSP